MKITVIGEMCDDVFVYGESKRLSPEAPVPVFLPKYKIKNIGMAGNVVKNLLSINKKVSVTSIHQSSKIVKIRYVDDKTNHMFLRVDEKDFAEKFILQDSHILDIKNSDAVIISDYDKGFLTEKHIKKIASISKFCVLDTKKKLEESTIKFISFIKLNEHEFKNSNIVLKENIKKIIITKGISGTDYMGVNYPSPKPIQTMDVSGAGDTFTAAFTLKYIETKNTAESIVYANEMASLVVSKRGVATPK